MKMDVTPAEAGDQYKINRFVDPGFRHAGKTAFMALFLVVFSISLAASAQSPVTNEDDFALQTLWDAYKALPQDSVQKVGLALGGGGARGLAHIGILKVFQEEQVPIHAIAGTSVGALIGGLYAAGVPTSQLETMARDIGWDALTNYSRVSFLRLVVAQKLLSTDRMESYLRRHIGDRRFDELKIPFSCVATDLQTGERVIFREGNVALAARASATIPGLFEPVMFRHRFLVDGGLVGNVPTDLARALGGQVIIAVDISSDFSKFDPKNVLSTVSQAILIQSALLSQAALKEADWVIRPAMEAISPIDLTRSEESMDAGTLAARRAIPSIKQILIDHELPRIWNFRKGPRA